ncbi:MAG TPA: AzlD domain-containing protein [Treponemataceae bacterium]|nr:AzlD domain-containing protein [Treponemataceae bacterium]
MHISKTLFSIAFMALAIVLTRFFPFVLFSKREPPRILQFVADYLPPLVMAVLVIYCLKDVRFSIAPYGLPELAAIVFCVITYLWKHNAMISIFGGLIIFMFLQQ